MKRSDVNDLQRRIAMLVKSLKAPERQKELNELIGILRKPGRSRRANFKLISGFIDGMNAYLRAISDLPHALQNRSDLASRRRSRSRATAPP